VTGNAAVEAESGTGASTGSSGGVSFPATSHDVANSHSDLASGGLLGGLSIAVPTAEVEAPTDVSIDGSVSSSTSVTMQAQSANFANVQTSPFSVGLIGAGAGVAADAEVTTSAKTDALIGPNSGSGASIHSSGQISLLAFSANTAASDASSTTGSLGLAIALEFEKTRIEGETKADSE